VEVQGCW